MKKQKKTKIKQKIKGEEDNLKMSRRSNEKRKLLICQHWTTKKYENNEKDGAFLARKHPCMNPAARQGRSGLSAEATSSTYAYEGIEPRVTPPSPP